jgi:hypothetical protein
LKFSAPKFKDCLSWQEMDGVSEGLRAPEQAIVNNRIVLSPVVIAISLPNS